MRRRQVTIAVSLALPWLLLVPVKDVSAGQRDPASPDRQPASVYSAASILDVFGTDGPDQIDARLAQTSSPKLELNDPAGLVVARGRCRRVAWTTLLCPLPFGDFSMEGSRGNDVLHAHGRLRVHAFFSAGPGNDTVIDGHGKSYELGGPGADTMEGGPGHDRIYGQAGVDSLEGGAGPDGVHANDDDDDVDELIDCGGGEDHASLDAVDPIPSGCERVVTR